MDDQDLQQPSYRPSERSGWFGFFILALFLVFWVLGTWRLLLPIKIAAKQAQEDNQHCQSALETQKQALTRLQQTVAVLQADAEAAVVQARALASVTHSEEQCAKEREILRTAIEQQSRSSHSLHQHYRLGSKKKR